MRRLRHRPSELQRETTRRSTTMAIALGGAVRAARRRSRLTQRQLAERIASSQTEISRIERGSGARAPLETWIALGIALGRPLAVQLTRPLGEAHGEPRDAGHLAIQDAILRLARETGRQGTFEVPTRPDEPMRSTDVGIRDPVHGARILVECWNSFGDLGSAVRSTTRKRAEAQATWPKDRVATVWIVRDTAANRSTLARYEAVIRSAFPGSSRRWLRALTVGDLPPPTSPAIVWWDGATGRLREHRRASMRP